MREETYKLLHNPASIMRRVHARLETDPVSSKEEFSKIFGMLHEGAKISLERFSGHLEAPVERVRGWIEGIDLPEEPFFPLVAKKLLELIDIILDELEESEKT